MDGESNVIHRKVSNWLPREARECLKHSQSEFKCSIVIHAVIVLCKDSERILSEFGSAKFECSTQSKRLLSSPLCGQCLLGISMF